MKAVFAVCVRNVERQLSFVLANIERIATIYDDAAFVFVENDSVSWVCVLFQFADGR